MTTHAIPLWTDKERAQFCELSRVRAAAREHQLSAWLDGVRRQVGACAEMLRRDFGATSVVLFGSVARGDAQLESDVDLLVAGIAPSRWFDAVASARDVVSSAEVDLVPAEKVHPHIAARVAVEGQAQGA